MKLIFLARNFFWPVTDRIEKANDMKMPFKSETILRRSIMNFITCTMAATCVAAFAGSALAAVSAEEAKQLGGPVLTEWGAERAGNKDGSIPAYTAERVKIPASYDPKEPGRYPDPFGDKPLYTITAQNMDKYADKLTDGMKALFKIYPTYRMDIYQTHRTTIYPKYVIENSIKNATACKTANNGLRLEGCYGGVPFPIPKTGNEVIWNHLVSFNAPAFQGVAKSWIVDSTGKPQLQAELDVNYHFPYWDDTPGQRASNSLFWKLRFDYIGPARRVGEKYVILNSLDALDPGQRAYIYVPGQRRVKLAPDLAYDTPSPVSGGSSTMDEQQGFLGAQDRYNFKLIGKKEVYMNVNTNKTVDYKACPIEKLYTKNFANPDCMRWELRRAWVVEGTLKPGFRHIIPRRMIYFDEDGPLAAVGDMFDAGGKLFRFDFNPQFVVYGLDGNQWTMANTACTYDLNTGLLYWSTGLNHPGGGYYASKKPKSDFYFSPEALAGEGIR